MTHTTTFEVVKAVAETYRVTISFEEKLNNFLDELLSIKNDFSVLIETWNEANDLTRAFVNRCDDKDALTVVLLTVEGLVSTAEHQFEKHKKHLSSILPSVISDFEDSLDSTREILNDIRIKISDNPELLKAEQNLINLGF